MNNTDADIIWFATHFQLFEELRRKSLLITGVSGQIGSAMARCLSALNDKHGLGLTIYGQTRNADAARRYSRLPDDVVLLESPLERIAEVLSSDSLDAVIHLAAPTASLFFVNHPVETISSIVDGTRSVLEFARSNKGMKILYVSSMEVYGSVPDHLQPVDEHSLGSLDIANPRSSYPLAKRLAEHLCLCYGKEYGLSVRIARPCQTFGAVLSPSDQRVYAQIARSVQSGAPVVLNTPGNQSHCFCDTTDMVSGLLYVLFRGEDQGVYNIANPDTYCSIRQMAEQVCSYFDTGSEVRIELDSTKGYPSATTLLLDTRRIQALGWKPRKGLMEMYNSMLDSLC